MVDDPQERWDLSLAEPEIVAKLMHRLDAYNATAVPCSYPPPDLDATPCAHKVEGVPMWGPYH